MTLKSECSIVAAHAARKLDLKNASLGDEYRYMSLPLCVIDAVFSINNKYKAVQNVVARYCASTKQRRIRGTFDLPSIEAQQSISAFCDHPEQSQPAAMAAKVYENTQLTSPRGGILKADAAARFAKCLRKHGVQYFQDLPAILDSNEFEKEIRTIPGQKSGLSLQYFWMLAGSDNLIKPDRMVVRFLETALSRRVTVKEASALLVTACEKLKSEFPRLTPRMLDHEVWKHQRQSETGKDCK